HLVGLVRRQRDGKPVLALKGVLRLHWVGGHAEDRGVGLGEGGFEPVERDGLAGAARGVGLRVEVEDELFAAKILERDLSAVVADEAEVRRLGAGHRRFRHMPSFRRFRRANVTREYRGRLPAVRAFRKELRTARKTARDAPDGQARRARGRPTGY